MINNTSTIRDLLKFPDENSFYFLEIIKRRKENPEMPTGQKLIKDFCIYSLEEYDNLNEKIIALCDEHNARAYFRLNMRDAKKVAYQFNRLLADVLLDGQYKRVANLYPKVVGGYHSDSDKKWVVDLDGEQAKPEFYSQVLNTIVGLRADAIVAIIPTLNGLHIISRPFNTMEFNKSYPGIDIHKDNPTIMYAA